LFSTIFVYNQYMILAIDYGKKRIGLALGIVIPRGIGVIDGALKEDEILEKIKKICDENDVEKIVIGLPFRSQGEIGSLGDEIKLFSINLCSQTNLPVFFQDEQFSSSEAERLIGKISKDTRRSGKVDEIAATLILESFLDRKEDIKPDIEPKK